MRLSVAGAMTRQAASVRIAWRSWRHRVRRRRAAAFSFGRAAARYSLLLIVGPLLVPALAADDRTMCRTGTGVEAMAACDRLMGPQNVGQFIDRGRAYFAKGDYDHAIADYNEAIRLDPKIYASLLDRGHAYFAKGDHDRAIADYGEMI